MSVKETPLLQKHLNLNAKMVDFAGYRMPVRYSGIRREHMAVRQNAGLFDVSHMGEFFLEGPDALDLIQRLTVNDASRLGVGDAQYTMLCNEKGGIIDDLLIYRTTETIYMLVVNAANIDTDRNWIERHMEDDDVRFTDRSDSVALLALQGPEARPVLSSITDISLDDMKPFTFRTGEVADQPDVLISATGYTGEPGFELYVDLDRADPGVIWDAILRRGESAGVLPVGLGARDTLRLEAGLPLHGQDLDESTTPVEAGLGWVVKSDKGEFVGRQKLRQQKHNGPDRRLTGLVTGDPKKIPRTGYTVLDHREEEIGTVTSGGQSPLLQSGIGFAYLPADLVSEGGEVKIRIRRSLVPATIKKPPFVDLNKS